MDSLKSKLYFFKTNIQKTLVGSRCDRYVQLTFKCVIKLDVVPMNDSKQFSLPSLRHAKQYDFIFVPSTVSINSKNPPLNRIFCFRLLTFSWTGSSISSTILDFDYFIQFHVFSLCRLTDFLRWPRFWNFTMFHHLICIILVWMSHLSLKVSDNHFTGILNVTYS